MRPLYCLFSSLILASTTFASNIVLNPGFEANDFALTGWSPGLSFFANTGGLGPHGGDVFAATDCVGTQCITDPARALSQELATNDGTYTLSFWYDLGSSLNDTTGNVSAIHVVWGGTPVLDVTNTNQPDPGYVFFSRSGLPGNSANGVLLQFFGRNDPSQLGIDDVCVFAAGETCDSARAPEPGTMWLLGGGFLGLAAVARRLKQHS